MSDNSKWLRELSQEAENLESADVIPLDAVRLLACADELERQAAEIAALKAELDEAAPMQTCARCGKQDRSHRMMIEEGDEWECWERCEAQERSDAKAKLETQ